ncbi:MAG TPA: 23S rRNA (adenine(2503)-C(2))-methyltransferase RlmN [Verrucomicrobiae bacterium]|nr:23S rRNA (adenine(2503)-C(2))-methyltransferase RlmN [Verrucomicrobiae bacterium]
MDLAAGKAAPQPSSLYGMDIEEAEAFAVQHHAPAYRGRQILEWIYQKNIREIAEAKTLPKDLRESIGREVPVSTLKVSEVKKSSNAESTKFLFSTHDGRLLETVLISQSDRETVCVSTQLGCKVGCSFCASGKGKFGRNLTAGEIVEQVAAVSRETGRKITNIVFMGMGEPLDNFDATMKALKILQAPWGFALGSRRITVSTSGITPRIVQFVEKNEGRVRLSVSLHSSNEATRTELVPINKRYTLKELVETLGKINRDLKRDITFEFTLIDGVNDSPEEARGVVKIAKPLNAKVNIIPYNPIREMEYKTPSKQKLDAFVAILERGGLRVIVRQTAGRDINAACGQLRLDREQEKKAG